LTPNFKTLTRLIYAAAPRFVGRGCRAIVNISSAVTVYPEILNGARDGAKAATSTS
jgi:short-subunit dehydrogenase